MGQYRGIITIVTFLAIILIVIGAAVAQTPTFFTGSPTGNSPSVPGGVVPSSLLSWNETSAVILNSTHTTQDYTIPNWHSTWWISQNYLGSLGIHVYTYDTWWVFAINQESLTWQNETTGVTVSTSVPAVGGDIPVMFLTTLTAAYDPTFNLNYRLTNSRGTLHVVVAWNNIAYGGNATLAYYGSGIVFSLKQDFSDRQTTLNLVDVISGLFFGSIFGANTLNIDPIMSAILTIALDSALVYIAFTIVRSLIPFLPGGD